MVASFMFQLLYPTRKSFQYPLDKRFSGPLNQCRHDDTPPPKKNLPGFKNFLWPIAALSFNINDRQSTYNYNIEVCLCNHCCSGQAINTTYSEGVFVQYGFWKKLLNIKCVFLYNISLKRISF